MRLIHSFNNPDEGKQFSQFLLAKGVEHKHEVMSNSDWGSEDYGTLKTNIWIVDEDQTLEAARWLELFLQDPTHEDFNVKENTPMEEFKFIPNNAPPSQRKIEPVREAPFANKKSITTYILFICGLLFIIGQITRPYPTSIPKGVPLTPILTSTINKTLMYDYPEKFVLIDKITALYGIDSLENPRLLPPEGQFFFKKSIETPYWDGIYKDLVKKAKEPESPIDLNNIPMFEKIKKGEIWRLFTPCLLHSDIFHIFFNMIWLLVLGRQMEKRLGAIKYIFFIVIAAIFSNTAQYLMSGANFIGFSGVICGMILFIWTRQQRAPWEGYHLHRSSMMFVSIFVLTILGIQVASFILEVMGYTSFHIGIANTAHISGAFVGYVISRYNLLRVK